MQPERGDVVGSADPFKLGEEKQRPWLVISDDSHPFTGEQCVVVAISTKRYEDSLELSDEVWETGGVPRNSFVSPWAVHSPRTEDFVAWQGRVSDGFVDRVVEVLTAYL